MSFLGISFEILMDILDALICMDFILGFNKSRWKEHKEFILFTAIFALVIYISNLYHDFSVIDLVLYSVVCFGFTYRLKEKSSWVRRLFSCALFMIMLTAIASIVLLLIQIILDIHLSELTEGFKVVRVGMILCTKILFFTFTRILIRLIVKTEDKIPYLEGVILVFISVLSTFILTVLMNIAVKINMEKGQEIEIVLVGMSLFVFDFLVYILFIKINNIMNEKLNYQKMVQKYEYEKNHFEECKNIYDRARILKHDINSHLQCILGFLENENITGAVGYIAQVKKELDKVYNFVHTSNEVLNYIINTKCTIAQDSGIKVSVKISDSLSDKMNLTDISSLLGNILDNAITASQKEENKEILLELGTVQGYYVFTVKNRISKSVMQGNPELETTKKDRSNHGLGLKQIKQIADKYNGYIDIYEIKNMFVLSVFVPN